MLASLATRFDTVQNVASAARLKEAFSKETMKEGDTIASLTARLMKYRTELAHTPHTISESDMTIKLLACLPAKWQNIKEFIHNSGQFTWDNAVSMLLQNQHVVNQQSIGTSQNNTEGTLAAGSGHSSSNRGRGGRRGYRGRGSRGGRSSSNSSSGSGSSSRVDKRCFYCANLGHLARDCKIKAAAEKFKKERDDKGKERSKDNEAANVVIGDGNAEYALALAASNIAPAEYQNEFFLDSACTVHLTNKQKDLQNYKRFHDPIPVFVGDGRSVNAIGTGDIVLPSTLGTNFRLRRAWHTPDIGIKLISIDRLNDEGYKVDFLPSKACHILLDGNLVATGSKAGKFRKFDVGPAQSITNTAIACSTGSTPSTDTTAPIKQVRFATETMVDTEPKPPKDCAPDIEPTKPVVGSIEHWHRRLGHLNVDSVKRVLTQAGIAWNNKIEFNRKTCLPYLHGKQHITRRKSQRGTTRPLELVHSDTSGKLSGLHSGYRYFMLFIDDYTRMTWVYFLKTKEKEECTEAFLQLKRDAEASGYKSKRFRCDNEKGEYNNKLFKRTLETSAITYEPAAPHSQWMNGVSERSMRTIGEMARSMLAESGLPGPFWAEAVSTAVYNRNRASNRAIGYEIPYYRWTGTMPVISHMQPFGCVANIVSNHRDKEERSLGIKWASKSEACIFLGYVLDTTKIYKVWSIKRKTAFRVLDLCIRFNENKFPRLETFSLSQILESL